MTDAEQALLEKLQGSDSLELVKGGQISTSRGVGAALSQIVGNPPFKAEISLNIHTRYYSQAAVGTPVVVAAAAIPVAQQTTLPVYIFGNSDFAANYARARQIVPGGGGWNYADMKVIIGGKGEVGYHPLPHAAASVEYQSGTVFNNLLNNGDVLFVIPMLLFVAGVAGTTITAEIQVTCANVPYTTLIDSLSSDLITLNMIRYTVGALLVAQLTNQITLIRQSLFGKTNTDTLDPNTYITGGTYNPNIADIPITIPIDKNLVLSTVINFDAILINWVVTVATIKKLTNV